MPNASEIPDKAELERQQLYLANEKLRIETSKLKADSSPEKWWSRAKNVVAIGGVVTVAATVYGLWDSYNKSILDRERTRMTEQRTQFGDAIKKFESSNTISKLVGVSVLNGYLNADDKPFHRQILFTLASLFATERDLQTQAAVADLVSGVKSDAIAKEDWFYFQSILASQSRALMAKGNIIVQRQFHVEGIAPSNEEVSARFIGRLMAINVRKGVVPHYLNYRGIYCEDCDFHDAQFPENADFTGSVLDNANFRGATLQGASFDNADLGGVVFSEAFLGSARFRSLSAGHVGDGLSIDEKDVSAARVLTPYLVHVQRVLETQAILTIAMPDFSCANLQNAHFDELALFPFFNRSVRTFAIGDEAKGGWHATVPDYLKRQATEKAPIEFSVLSVIPPSFYKSELRGAHLDRARYFSLVANGEKRVGGFRSAVSSAKGPFAFFEGKIDESAFEVPPLEEDGTAKPVNQENKSEMERNSFQNNLRISFYQATIEGAALPPGVAGFLQAKVARDADYRRWFQSTFRANGVLDWSCKPRNALAK